MIELWKDIEGYEGLYQVSNLGRVKSLKKGKILKQHDNGKGYMQVGLWKNNKGKCYYVHRLVSEAFVDNPENKPQINHKDKNKTNNCVYNLEWVTCKENQHHKVNFEGYKQKGRNVVVEFFNGNTQEYTRVIDLAEELHCSRDIIYDFVNGKHIPTFDKLGIKSIIIKNKQNYNTKGNTKKVTCITTGEVFNSIGEAGRQYHIETSGIIRCCQGKLKWSGKLPDGTKLVWQYVA